MSLPRAPLALFAALVLTAGSAASAEPRGEIRPTVVASPSESSTPLSDSAFDPARAWNDLGCVSCHGDDGIYRDEIKGALGKPVAQVARWIRNAPSIKPGTDMPSFEGLIDEPSSVALASWVLDRAAHLD